MINGPLEIAKKTCGIYPKELMKRLLKEYEEQLKTRVINLHHNLPYDVYIGRGSMFGNPFTHITDRKTLAQFVVRTREEAIEKYKYYFIKRIESEQAFKKAVERLRCKVLGCYCKPKSCHGDVIVEYLESTTERIVE